MLLESSKSRWLDGAKSFLNRLHSLIGAFAVGGGLGNTTTFTTSSTSMATGNKLAGYHLGS